MDTYKLMKWDNSLADKELPIPTDDWPYLYLRTKTIPNAYWQTLLVLVVVSYFIISRSFGNALRPDWQFWFLGAGFLLIEFKSITEFALLFGTTWLVNVFAISGVLLMALLANLFVLKWNPIPLKIAYILLFGCLAINFFFPLHLLIGLTPFLRAIISMILLSLPLFFSGLIFSESLRRANETSLPLASNLSGSVAGGVLEYGSLLWGIKSLYLIAAVVYLGAFISSRVKKS